MGYARDDDDSGFDLDDSESFEDMYGEAEAAGAAATDLDDSNSEDSFIGRLTARETPEPESRRGNRAQEREMVQEAPQRAPEPFYTQPEPVQEQPQYTPPVFEPEPEPVQLTPPVPQFEATEEFEPLAPLKPSKEPTRTITPSRPRVSITPESEEIEKARKIISVTDVYRDLTNDVKNVVSQFILNDSDFTEDEATIIVRAINSDQTLFETMKALREAKESDQVERVFYVLSLEDKILYKLGDLVSIFTQEDIENSGRRLDYARSLVASIDSLDKKSIDYVVATERVLKAAR